VLAFTEPVQPRGISGYDLSTERKEVEGVSRFVQARGLTGLTSGNTEHISLVVEYLRLVVDYLVSRFVQARGLTGLTHGNIIVSYSSYVCS
jgi:hypothetical protein